MRGNQWRKKLVLEQIRVVLPFAHRSPPLPEAVMEIVDISN